MTVSTVEKPKTTTRSRWKPSYLNKMDPEIKAKWLTALRSGSYEQGPAVLHKQTADEHKYCCLGVLCEIGVLDGVVERSRNGVDGYDGDVGYRLVGSRLSHFLDMMPNDEIQDWANLPDRAMHDLAELNDTARRSFSEIADFIEEHL